MYKSCVLKTPARYVAVGTVMVMSALAGCSKAGLPGDPIPQDAMPFSAPAQRPTDGLGPIESRLFPPDLIMENQGAIGIQAPQKEAILREVERAQS